MVNLTRIYTRTGDGGGTRPGGMGRTTKKAPRPRAPAAAPGAGA